MAAEKAGEVRVLDPDPAVDHRHGHADLGGRPDRALSRPRADEPRALRGRGVEPRQRPLDRGGPEVFRARRAVVRHAALRLLADLRLHRHRLVRRHRQGRRAGRHRAHLRPRVPVRGLLLQGLRGAVPHVDARRLRGRADAGHRVLRRRAEDRRDGDLRPRHHHRVPRHHAAMAADRGVRLHRLDGARRLRGDRPDATSSG